jgi:hypothetical protein
MALQAAGSALVAGGSQESAMQLQVTKVRVTRAFYFDKKPTKVGSVVELPKVFAAEMIAAHKAEPVDSERSEEAPPPAPEKPPASRGASKLV